jgi:hypothetical protein
VGVANEFQCGAFFVNAEVKAAVGPNFQRVTITSVTTAPTVAAGGSVFGPADVGPHNRTRFSVVPEANFNVGWRFFDWFRAYAGYDFLYMLNAARPAEQTVAGNQIQVLVAGTGTPASVAPQQFHFGDVNAWFQGLVLGCEFRY